MHFHNIVLINGYVHKTILIMFGDLRDTEWFFPKSLATGRCPHSSQSVHLHGQFAHFAQATQPQEERPGRRLCVYKLIQTATQSMNAISTGPVANSTRTDMECEPKCVQKAFHGDNWSTLCAAVASESPPLP